VSELSEKKEYVENCKKNESLLREALSELRTQHGDGVFGYNAKTFFGHVKEINNLFKIHKPLFKESRSALWGEFQETIENRKQSFDQQKSDKENRSHPYYQMIMNELHHADHTHILNPSIDELKLMSEYHQKAGQLLSQHKDDMTHEHKTDIFENLNRIRNTLDKYWEGYKKESQSKRDDFIARTRRNIAKNQERLEKQYTFLQHLEQNHSKNMDQLYEAKGDDFRNTVQGWIDETEEKISDTRQSITEIEGWIEEDQRKL